MGATSGIGRRVAEILISKGWTLAVCGRNRVALDEVKSIAPERVCVFAIDVTAPEADTQLQGIIGEMEADGTPIDLYFHISGVGSQNKTLAADIEERTVMTNAMGWTRLVGVAYRHFAARGKGHIAAVSSIAGTRGMGAAPSYSATKAFQNAYLEALAQQTSMRRLDVCITDIRPGFVRTPLLGEAPTYPMLMEVEPVARAIVRAVEKRKAVTVIDWRWRIVTAFWKLIPHRVWRRMRVG